MVKAAFRRPLARRVLAFDPLASFEALVERRDIQKSAAGPKEEVKQVSTAWHERLPAFSLFAAVLSGAEPPIYIYAPKYYTPTLGVSLTALGALLLLRLLTWSKTRSWDGLASVCEVGVGSGSL